MKARNLCIYFSDTGGGHRSAAEAIGEAIEELVAKGQAQDVPKILYENPAEKSHPINRAFVDLYNWLLRHHQSYMKYYYSVIHALKPNDSELGYRISFPYLKKMIERTAPKLMVSVHPMVNHYLARSLKDMGIADQVKLIVVVTDPNEDLWLGWACKDAFLTIVPNDLAAKRLLEWGIPAEKISILGMPIHPEFLNPPTVPRAEFLKSLGLESERLTICINSGWAGCKKMMHVYDYLGQIKRPLQCIFLAGHNQSLFEKLKQDVSNSSVPTAVLPFHDRMSDLMSACDLMVTKAGGLTTYEALARRLPMALDLLTEPMPQERGTANLMIEYNLAHALYQPEDIVDIVDGLPEPGRTHEITLPADHELNQVDAVYEIARTILKACDGVSLLTSTKSTEN